MQLKDSLPAVGTNIVTRKSGGFSYAGRIAAVMPFGLRLANASWMADHGRWAQFLEKGSANSQVEDYPAGVVIAYSAFDEITEWPHIKRSDEACMELDEMGLPAVGTTVITRKSRGFTYLGRVKGVNGFGLLLEDASWVADSGRWAQFLKDGHAPEGGETEASAPEIEIYDNDLLLAFQGFDEVSPWLYPLPRETI